MLSQFAIHCHMLPRMLPHAAGPQTRSGAFSESSLVRSLVVSAVAGKGFSEAGK